jgi:transposase InsO family protein
VERYGSTSYQRVVALSQRYDYWGYRKIYDLLREQAGTPGREGVRLIRRREGLLVPKQRPKRRLRGDTTLNVAVAAYPNHVWSYDFVFDVTEDGRTMKCLTVVDEYTRVGLGIVCRRSYTARDVEATLAWLIDRWGKPASIRSDNGGEFLARRVKIWLQENCVGTHYIDPGSPWQNPFNESFNSVFRITCLNRYSFRNLTEARAVIKTWLDEYNAIRPHGSLGGSSPIQFLRDWSVKNPDQQTMTMSGSLT